MARSKSLLIRVEIDYVLKAHNCQANAKHRLQKGEPRLKVRKGRSWDHYCGPCATLMLERGLADLTELQRRFAESDSAVQQATSSG